MQASFAKSSQLACVWSVLKLITLAHTHTHMHTRTHAHTHTHTYTHTASQNILSRYCHKCTVDLSHLNLTRLEEEGQGVYEISGAVFSSDYVVSQLNDTLHSLPRGLTTRGLMVRLNGCSVDPPPSPITLIRPITVAVGVGGIAVVLTLVCVTVILVCWRSHR